MPKLEGNEAGNFTKGKAACRLRFGDPQAINLFARLFSYAPRPIVLGENGKRLRRRNALEDFCTEALAWCLTTSQDFAAEFLKLDCFAPYGLVRESLEVETQVKLFGHRRRK